MKIDHFSLKKILLIDLIVILSIAIVIPLVLDLFGLNIKIIAISFIGNFLIISTIIITIVDLFYLIRFRRNIYLLASLSMSFTISLFLLLEYCFLNDYYDFIYVWSYSKSTLPIIYKMVAIWAGEAGSIMTWMLFNSIIIFFYRLKNQIKDDIIFIISVIISLLISSIFLVILFSYEPFQIQTPFIFPNGLGLNPLLISPFMIWHPLFTFIAYAIFLIPFTISIIEIIKPNFSLENPYQKSFYDFCIKFGWLVLTVSIGLGAYWAKIALNWGRYWGWDPVETVSLVPWFLSTAYFHTRTFKKKNSRLVKINIISIFLSIVFSTLITRGGGLTSLHAFTGENNLVTWTLIVGSALIIFSLYVIYNSLNSLSEEYKKTRLLLDYLSYIFLFMLAFVCIFGLFITPLSVFLSTFFSFNIIFVGTDFFILTTLILASGLALTLIFCSLYGIYKLKWIAVALIIGVVFQSVISLVLFLFSSIWINPLIAIFILALLTSILKLIKDFDSGKGIKHFFKINSKTYVHIGLSLILIGTLIDPETWFFQDIFFISGFLFLVSGIIPSILILLILKRNKE
ncbi:MAG: cytochrome c biogenesis protein CcsA [Candidatus Lokiarchaeota archaeon]|nr:cytochrome c biogenesis protein CcsA [Candidatus Lokiarchaeota archaeon]